MSKKKVVKSGSQDGTASEGSLKGCPDPDSTPGIPEHHKIIHLPLDKVFYEENSSGLETILLDLNVLFSSVGTVITVEGTSLTIDIHEEKFHSVTTRKAGRKSKRMKTERYEEIIAYRKNHTAMETAEWLGLTKQTYYRRMKDWKEETMHASD